MLVESSGKATSLRRVQISAYLFTCAIGPLRFEADVEGRPLSFPLPPHLYANALPAVQQFFCCSEAAAGARFLRMLYDAQLLLPPNETHESSQAARREQTVHELRRLPPAQLRQVLVSPAANPARCAVGGESPFGRSLVIGRGRGTGLLLVAITW